MKSVEGATEEFARVMRDSYEKVVEHAVAVQERNARFVLGVISDSSEEVRRQAEANRALARELVEISEKQRDDLRVVVDESLDAYVDLMFAPLSYYREGVARAAR